MIGSFLTRGLVLVFGYAYPAYECYKTVEKNKPEIEQLRFWCQYWILVAFLTVCERIGDAFISWVPMYSEAKLAFFVYLWYPKTKGTTYVYDSFFRPYIAKHETEIDRNLLELRTRAGDMIVLYWQRAATYGQTRVFEILQYVAAQSTQRPRPQEQAGTGAHQPPTSTTNRQTSALTRQPSIPRRQQATTAPEPEEPPSPTSSISSTQQPMEVEEEGVPSKVPETAPLPSLEVSNAPTVNTTARTSSQSAPTETKAMHTETAPSSTGKENADPVPKETLMEETMRVTRGRLRNTRSGGNRQ